MCAKFGAKNIFGYLLSATILLAYFSDAAFAQQDVPQTGVTIQLPVLGVSVDANGVLQTQVFPDQNGRLMAMRRQAAQGKLTADIQKKSKLRFVSLRRLEAALEKKIANGEDPDEDMLVMAGLQRTQFVFVLPEKKDIVIAGPAEGWMTDLSGRRIGIDSRKPTLLLNDLMAAMRIFAPRQKVTTWVAISIDPTAEGIQRLNEFKKTMPQRISDSARDQITPRLVTGLRDSLGLANVNVYGVPRTTHLSNVMIEADYRMKLMAVGLEPPPIRMSTFIGELTGAPRGMQRWWLTPNYQCVKQANDKLSVELVGRGVQLKTDIIWLGQKSAKVSKTNARKTKPSKAARRYASSFTKMYEQISAARPVFAQLRNAIDLLVLSAWILKNDGYNRANWQPSILLDESQLPIRDQADIRKAPCVANAVWKGRVLVLPSGGGVSIQASDALLEKNLIEDKKNQLPEIAGGISLPKDDRWWWD